MGAKLKGCAVTSGVGRGELLITGQAISFWGGVDPATGAIIDPRHELFGQSIAGKVLAFPQGKGSSTTSLIILELVRLGRQPRAIVNVHAEPILATGPIVSKAFYGKSIPMVTLSPPDFEKLRGAREVVVDADRGWVETVR